MKNTLFLSLFIVTLYVASASSQGLLGGLERTLGVGKSDDDEASGDNGGLGNAAEKIGSTVKGLTGGLLNSKKGKSKANSSKKNRNLLDALKALVQGTVEGGTGSVTGVLGHGMLGNTLKELKTLSATLPEIVYSLSIVAKDLPTVAKSIPILVKGLPIVTREVWA